MLKILYKLSINFVTIILIVLASISLISFINSTKQKNYITGVGNLMFLSVLSGSMSPTFNTYDMIIDTKTEVQNVKIGNIITYQRDNDLVTHRVTDIFNKDGRILFKTKGDANNTEDLGEVPDQAVVGKFIFRIPYLGLIMAKLKGKLGIYAVCIMAFYVYISETLYLVLERRKRTYPMRRLKKDREWNSHLEKYE